MFRMDWHRFDKFVGFPFAKPPTGPKPTPCKPTKPAAQPSTSTRPDTQPPASTGPVILVPSVSDYPMVKLVCGNVLASLKAKAQVKIATDGNEAKALMDQHPNPAGIFIADTGITAKSKKPIARRIAQYVQDGGTVVIGGVFSSSISGPAFDKFFDKIWSLPCQRGSYHRTTFHPNKTVAKRLDPGLPPSYSQKATHVKGVNKASALYLPGESSRAESLVFSPSPIEDKSETPVALEQLGKGWLGYTGDVNSEEETARVVLGMFNLV